MKIGARQILTECAMVAKQTELQQTRNNLTKPGDNIKTDTHFLACAHA